jgi:AcrR family transcriptional regulator
MNEEHIIAGTDPPPKMKEEATPQAVRRETAISALLSAARELVAKYGVAGATLARIGEKAGYSRGLVAHYFGTKEKLIEALIWDQRATYIRLLQQLEAENGLEKLIQAIAVYVDAGANLQTYGRAYFVLRPTS